MRSYREIVFFFYKTQIKTRFQLIPIFSSVFRSFKVHNWNVISDLKNLKSRQGFKMSSKTHTFQKEKEKGYEKVLRMIML